MVPRSIDLEILLPGCLWRFRRALDAASTVGPGIWWRLQEAAGGGLRQLRDGRTNRAVGGPRLRRQHVGHCRCRHAAVVVTFVVVTLYGPAIGHVIEARAPGWTVVFEGDSPAKRSLDAPLMTHPCETRHTQCCVSLNGCLLINEGYWSACCFFIQAPRFRSGQRGGRRRSGSCGPAQNGDCYFGLERVQQRGRRSHHQMDSGSYLLGPLLGPLMRESKPTVGTPPAWFAQSDVTISPDT